MIAVVATGTRNGDLGARREKLIEDTIGVCIDELKLDRFRAVIHVKQTRSKKYMDGWAVGYATMDKVETETGNMWWAIIELCNASPKDIVKTLCHEMVHVKQYSRRELTERFPQSFWHGELFTDGRCYPWELEAWDMQRPLAHKYIKERTDWSIRDIKVLDKRS